MSIEFILSSILFYHTSIIKNPSFYSPSQSINQCCTPNFTTHLNNNNDENNSAKLKKWNTVDEVHRTVEIPEAPNRKSGPAVNTALPPPPPPPPLPGGLKPPPIHLMKPLHVVTGSEGPPSPGSSSFYSPGTLSTIATFYLFFIFPPSNLNFITTN